jgi:hypothetical protein
LNEPVAEYRDGSGTALVEGAQQAARWLLAMARRLQQRP